MNEAELAEEGRPAGGGVCGAEQRAVVRVLDRKPFATMRAVRRAIAKARS